MLSELVAHFECEYKVGEVLVGVRVVHGEVVAAALLVLVGSGGGGELLVGEVVEVVG